jgi:hypothetical protein
MATAAMVVGGAVVNALAFSGSNYLFSKLSSDEERKRHDKALEDLAIARDDYDKRRLPAIDYANNRLMEERKADKNFDNSEEAIKLYYEVTLGPPPKLSDFYEPSETQKNNELLFIVIGMIGVYFFAKQFK